VPWASPGAIGAAWRADQPHAGHRNACDSISPTASPICRRPGNASTHSFEGLSNPWQLVQAGEIAMAHNKPVTLTNSVCRRGRGCGEVAYRSLRRRRSVDRRLRAHRHHLVDNVGR
jgi:hypothetical protein